MNDKQSVLLKVTGIAFIDPKTGRPSSNLLRSLARQIKQLHDRYSFAIVTGAGNLFRGRQQGKEFGLTESMGHQVGMLATGLNGLIIQDIFSQETVDTVVLSAFDCHAVGNPITPQTISQAQKAGQVITFVGGTGNPFFTTDTTAIVRGLQIGATQVWKATNVDGIFDDNPYTNPEAKLLKKLSYDQAYEQDLAIMDLTAFALAREHKLPIRVFNIFAPDALLKAAEDKNFGSIVC